MKAKRFNKVAVIMGGPSAEREVSLRSGKAVARGLRDAGYDVVDVDIRGREFRIPEQVEAVFIALHGEFGEDGQIQAMLDQREIPYTGSGADASKVAFDKKLSKGVFVESGIPTPEYEVLREGGKRTMSLPVVIKPACQGSTIGVHRVLSESEWAGACNDALSYGREVIVETYISGRELTVGIVENEALPVIEIVAPGDWYDYRAKYTKGASRYLVPAPISKELSRSCQSVALQAFRALGCRGFARADLRVSGDDQIHVLELNSIPGFTETSLLPMAAAEAGLNFPELCSRIMSLAEVG